MGSEHTKGICSGTPDGTSVRTRPWGPHALSLSLHITCSFGRHGWVDFGRSKSNNAWDWDPGENVSRMAAAGGITNSAAAVHWDGDMGESGGSRLKY
jgi:hypothetical protein